MNVFRVRRSTNNNTTSNAPLSIPKENTTTQSEPIIASAIGLIPLDAHDEGDSDLSQVSQPTSRIKILQLHINEVTGMMKSNISKLLERDVKICKLEDQSEELVARSGQFERLATRLKRKMWFKNFKLTAGASVVVIVVVGVVVLAILV